MTNNDLWAQWRDRLSGVWKCTAFEMYDTSSNEQKLVAKPHGDNPLGRAVLTPAGFLSAHVSRPDRIGPLPSGNPWTTGEDKEVAHVARGLSMYCGFIELLEDENGVYWQTTVEVSSDPARVGNYEVRRVEYSEEGGKSYMKLRPKQDMLLEDGRKTRAVLSWEKIEKFQ